MSVRGWIKVLLLGVGLLAAACAPTPQTEAPVTQAEALPLPGVKTFPNRAAPRPTRSNASIAEEFMKLSFQLESGRRLDVFSRFEGPITLRVAGAGLNTVSQKDLSNLLTRLRNEAQIDIRQVPRSEHANITVFVLSQKELNRAVPNAACFVAPRVESLAEYKANRNTRQLDWTTLKERSKLTVFLPGDVAPQEIRDCLHEEIAQALGPVNDLYELPDSIFNDDNFRTVLTGFDMVVLRAYYDPTLRSGMSPSDVAARLPGILDRINPGGRSGFASATSTPRPWINQIEASLGGKGSRAARKAAAYNAVQIARALNWNDNRLGFSLYVQGRLALTDDPELALRSFAEAEAVFRSSPNTRLHAAHISVQAAAFALSAGQPRDTLTIIDANSPIALRSENANLLASMLMIKAEALDALGRGNEADIVRRDSLGWARYGIGSEADIRASLREIANLNPQNRRIASR